MWRSLEEGKRREHVEDQHPRLATAGVLQAEARLDHRAVPRDNSRVVRHQKGRPRSRDVLEAGGRHPPPDPVEKLEEGPPRSGGRLVEAEVIQVERPRAVPEQVPEVDGSAWRRQIRVLANEPGSLAEEAPQEALRRPFGRH
jgi:hypothetical protein